MPNILGDIDKMPIPGVVTFTINGQEHKLEPVAEAGDKQFWFIFRDLTSQKETYPAARFLYAPAPVNGKDDSRLQQGAKPTLRLQPLHDVPAADRTEPIENSC